MKWFKQCGKGILAIILLVVCVAPAGAASADVEIVTMLGVLQGEGLGVTPAYLAQRTTRLQAAVITMRMMGAEEAALAYDGEAGFTDADEVRWVEGRNLLAYLHDNMERFGWRGYPDQSFRPYEPATASMIYKIILVALGYEEDVDFDWGEVGTFAADRGLSRIINVEELTNADLAVALVEGLRADMAEGDQTLVDVLIESEDLERAVGESYQRTLAELGVQGLDGLPGAIDRYRQLFALVPGGETADHACRSLLDLHGELAGAAYARLFPEVSDYYVASGFDHSVFADPDRITDPAVESTVRFLNECGYDVIAREGMLEITGRPGFLLSFTDYVTEPLAQYLELRAEDIVRPVVLDAALQISWSELARRAVLYDGLALAHPDLDEAEASRQRAEVYMTFYLRGIDNTPLFSWTDGGFDTDLKESYQWFVRTYPDSRFAAAVREFTEVLEQNGYRLTEAVREYLAKPLVW